MGVGWKWWLQCSLASLNTLRALGRPSNVARCIFDVGEFDAASEQDMLLWKLEELCNNAAKARTAQHLSHLYFGGLHHLRLLHGEHKEVLSTQS